MPSYAHLLMKASVEVSMLLAFDVSRQPCSCQTRPERLR